MRFRYNIPAMANNKTQMTDSDVAAFLATVVPARKAEEARTLDRLFRDVTGFAPRLWGPSIVGYGWYHYRYASGREGDFLATGFSPRKARHCIYILPGYQDYGPILSRLGKHKTGVSCLYVNQLADIDLDVLADLIAAGLRDLNSHWPVRPT